MQTSTLDRLQHPGVQSEQIRRAHDQSGVVTSEDLGPHARRSAESVGLVPIQPRTWLAATQPVGTPEQVAAVRHSVVGDYAFVDLTALWLYGLRPMPEVVRVGVAHSTRYRVRAPSEVTRLAPHLLSGSRFQGGCRVVALEVAVVQAAGLLPESELVELVEDVLRRRLTTLARLRARCRRGVRGSRSVRRAVDQLMGASLDAAVRKLVVALAARGVGGLRTEVRFTNAEGASAYADVLDEGSSTVLEVDGFVSHTDRQRFRTDRRRDRWMHEAHGLVTFRIDVSEVFGELDALADELAGLILSRRAASLLATG